MGSWSAKLENHSIKYFQEAHVISLQISKLAYITNEYKFIHKMQ